MPRKAYDTARQANIKRWQGAFQAASNVEENPLLQARRDLLTLWAKDPWAWLTAKDLDGRPLQWTTDERDDDNPIKPFPDKPHLKILTQEWTSPYRIHFLNKSRQMMASTLAMMLCDHYASFVPEREIVVSKVKLEDAVKLINDKIRSVHVRRPGWYQEEISISAKPQDIIRYPNGSTITAVAQNFADSSARGITASLVVVDEGAKQSYLPQIFQAILPMAVRVWVISTADVGNPGAAYMRERIYEGRPDLREEG